MFGSCVSTRFIFLSFLLFSFPYSLKAQSQQATVVNEGALVYQEADFDAPVIETLKRGDVYNVSKGQQGPFFKIRLKPGMTGWVADTDIKIGIIKLTSPKSNFSYEDESKKKKKKPFFAARYRGPAFDVINYSENTMGEDRANSLLFYGFKWNGFDTIFDGEIYADANVLIFPGAPAYYGDLTKKDASGFILMANFLLQTTLPQSKWHMVYYGFGPLFKFSNFALELPKGTNTLSYSAMDMNLGAVFDLGLAFRIHPKLSLRADVKYFWEKAQYLGLGLNLGFEF